MSWKKQQQIDLAWILLLLFFFFLQLLSCGKTFDPRFRYHVQQSWGGSLFCWPTQHTTFLYFFLGMPKKYWGKKNLNISIVGRQACLPASSFGMQRSNFKSFLRSIDKSNDYHHQGVDIKNRHQCVGKIVKKNKVSSVCSYNPIQAKKSFLWVTFLRGFQV